MLGTVSLWLTAAAAIGLLARLRGKRGLILLGICLLLVFLSVLVWNITLSFSLHTLKLDHYPSSSSRDSRSPKK